MESTQCSQCGRFNPREDGLCQLCLNERMGQRPSGRATWPHKYRKGDRVRDRRDASREYEIIRRISPDPRRPDDPLYTVRRLAQWPERGYTTMAAESSLEPVESEA